MQWFVASFFRFQSVSKGSTANILKAIALLLCFPCFQGSHFLFEVIYRLQQRRALLLSRYCAAQEVEDFGLEIDGLGLKGLSVAQPYHRLRNILGRLQRRHQTSNLTEPDHGMSPATASPYACIKASQRRGALWMRCNRTTLHRRFLLWRK